MKKISTLLCCFLLIFASSTYRVSADENTTAVNIRYSYDESTLEEGALDNLPGDANVIVEGIDFSFLSSFEKADLLEKLQEDGRNVIFHINDPDVKHIQNYKNAIRYYSEENSSSTTFVKGFEFEVSSTQTKRQYEKIVESLPKMTMYAKVITDKKRVVASSTLKLFDIVTLVPELSTSIDSNDSNLDNAYKTVIKNTKTAFASTETKVGVELNFDYEHSGYSDSSVEASTVKAIKRLVKDVTVSGETDYDDVVNVLV